jgi:uncharacterized membrane protein
MTAFHVISLLMLALAGAGLLLAPYLSPRPLYFTITVAPGFRATKLAIEILHRYQIAVAGWLVVSVLFLMGASRQAPWLAILAFVLPGLFGAVHYLSARNQVKQYAAPTPAVREAGLTLEEDRLPRWTLLSLPAFALPLWAVAYLRAHWDEMPQRFPVHWSVSGEPDRWVEKTPHAVYGPLIFGAGLMTIMLLLGIATFYGARRSPLRKVTLAMLIGGMYIADLVFVAAAMLPLWHFSPVYFVIPGVVFAIAALVWSYRYLKDPTHSAEPTPDDRWYLGEIYYNAHDPALFVQKRIGLGYTFNFGNRLSWIILASVLAGILGMIFLLP